MAFGDDPSRSVFFFTMVGEQAAWLTWSEAANFELLVLDDDGGAYPSSRSLEEARTDKGSNRWVPPRTNEWWSLSGSNR